MVYLNKQIELDGKYLLSLTNHNLKPDYATSKTFSHYDLEISYIKSGSGKYLVEDRTYEIHKGDIFIFNNIEPHVISSINPDEEFINTVIMFDPRFIWSIESNLFDLRYLKIFFERNERFQNRLEYNNPVTNEVAKLLLEIEDEFNKELPEYQLMIKVKLLNILVSLTRHYGHKKEDPDNPSRRRNDLTLINKVVDFISENLSNEIKLEDIAEIAHMNPSYFSTFFKKYLGISLSEYISKKRVDRACQYLKNSDKTILEIASLCGFNNTANFNKTFKKHMGKVPSDFR